MGTGSYPDYTKLVKRIGLTFATWVVVYVVFIVAAAIAGAPRVVLGVGSAVLVVAGLGVMARQSVSWLKETKRRQHAGRPQGVDGTDVVPGWRATGLPVLVLSCIAVVGLPLTLVGAFTHVTWLLIAGVVLLVVEVLDLAVVLPLRRARR